MAKYTTEVRSMCETYSGLLEPAGYSSIEDILTTSAPKVFDFDFPIFDEDYRLPLERKILKHYYTREISEETVGLWKLRLNAKMNEIMPYYNKLYESELLEFNPFYDTDLTTTHTRDTTGDTTENDTRNTNTTGTTTNTNTGTNNGSTTSDVDAWNKFSATPQGSISDLSEGKYLTNATNNTQDTKGTSNYTTTNNGEGTSNYETDTEGTTIGNSKTLEEFTEKIVGKRGSTSYAKLLKELRETFLNIDMLIIDDLSDLFFNLW